MTSNNIKPLNIGEDGEKIKEKIESLTKQLIEKFSDDNIDNMSDTTIKHTNTLLRAALASINGEAVHPSVRIIEKPN